MPLMIKRNEPTNKMKKNMKIKSNSICISILLFSTFFSLQFFPLAHTHWMFDFQIKFYFCFPAHTHSSIAWESKRKFLRSKSERTKMKRITLCKRNQIAKQKKKSNNNNTAEEDEKWERVDWLSRSMKPRHNILKFVGIYF